MVLWIDPSRKWKSRQVQSKIVAGWSSKIYSIIVRQLLYTKCFDAKAGSKGKETFRRPLRSTCSRSQPHLLQPLSCCFRTVVSSLSSPLSGSRSSRHGAIVWLMPHRDMKVKGLHRCLTFRRSQCTGRWACRRSLPISHFLTSRCRVFIQFTYGPSSKFIFLPTLQCKLGLSFYLVSELTILLRIQAWTTSVSSRRDSITKLNSAVGNSSLQELLSSQAQFLYHAVVFFLAVVFSSSPPSTPSYKKKETTTCTLVFLVFLARFLRFSCISRSFPSSFLLFFLSLLFPLSLSLRLYKLYLYWCSAIVCFGNIVTRGPAHWHGPAFA